MKDTFGLELRPLLTEGEPADFAITDLRDSYWSGESAAGPVRNGYYAVLWPAEESDATLHIDFSSYRFKRDGLFFVQPRQIHRVEGGLPPDGAALCFTDAFLARGEITPGFMAGLKIFHDQLQNEPLFIDPSRADKLSFYYKEISSAVNLRGTYAGLRLGALLKLFLIECTGVCDADLDTGVGGTLVLVKRFKDAVEASFMREHRVARYATELSVSPGYLSEVVKMHTGYTPKEYIQKRINLEARRLLRYSDIRVNELAYNLGFEDPHYFSRCFKQETGSTVTRFART